MSSRFLHVRLPEPLQEQLVAFCAASGQTVSAVVRGALAYALARPELFSELCGQPVLTVMQAVWTSEQIAQWQAYELELETFDMAAVAAQVAQGETGRVSCPARGG